MMEGKSKERHSTKKQHSSGGQERKKSNSTSTKRHKKGRRNSRGGGNLTDTDHKQSSNTAKNRRRSLVTLTLTKFDKPATNAHQDNELIGIAKINYGVESDGGFSNTSEILMKEMRDLHLDSETLVRGPSRLKMIDSHDTMSSAVAKSISSTLSVGSCPSSKSSQTYNPEESLRWEYTIEDPQQEQERITLYKTNRRKRYLAERQKKGLECTFSVYSSSSNSSASVSGQTGISPRDFTPRSFQNLIMSS